MQLDLPDAYAARLRALEHGAAVEHADLQLWAARGGSISLSLYGTTIACAMRLHGAAVALVGAGCPTTASTLATAAFNGMDDVVALLPRHHAWERFAWCFAWDGATIALTNGGSFGPAEKGYVAASLRWRRGSNRRVWLEALCA